MGRLIGKRVVLAVPAVFVSTILVFLVVHLAPGDPAVTLAGADQSPAVVAAIRAKLGLDKPLVDQYFSWLGGLFQGHLGSSYLSSLPVSQLLPSRIGATAELVVAGGVVAVLLGLALGSIAGFRQGRLADTLISALTGVLGGTPEFWFGLVLALVFAVKLRWLPPAGQVGLSVDPVGWLRSVTLPALAIALHPTALITRTVRSSIVDTLHEDYIRTARAKGVAGWRFYVRHVLKNALIPILTIVGLSVTRLLGGAIVIESVFAWPGIGLLLISSINSRDYQVVQATLLVFVLAVIVANLLTDIAYALADPRIRAGMTKTSAR